MMHILEWRLQITCPGIPEAPTSRQHESAKSQKSHKSAEQIGGIQKPSKSAEQIGGIQKPNKSAEQIGEIGRIRPPIWGVG